MIIKKRLFYSIILLSSLTILSMQANAACLPAGPFNGAANIIVCDPGANESFNTLGGNDSVTVNSGTVNNVDMSTGRDTFILNNGTVNNVDMGSAPDTFILNNGTVNTVDQGSFGDAFTLTDGNITSIDQGTGNDTATVVTGTMGTLLQSGGNDDITINGGVITLINQGTGNDTATMTAGTLTDLIQHSGSDTFTMSGGTVTLIEQGSSADILTFTGGSVLNLIDQGSFADTLTISGGTINAIDQGSGDDNLTISGATTGAIDQAAGVDDFIMGAGAVVASLDQGNDLDTATINGGHIVGLFDNGDTVFFHAGRIGDVDLKKADNIFIMDGALGAVSIDQDITAQEGMDTYTLTAGTIGGNVNSGSGDDIVTIDGTAIAGNLTTQNGNDTVSVASGSVTDISQGAGIDTLTISGGTINDIDQGAENDILDITGGTINNIEQGSGDDSLTISGATTGSIDQSSGVDNFVMGAGAVVTSLNQGSDLDTATINGGHIVGLFDNGDYVEFHAGQIGNVDLEEADNTFIMDGTLGAVSFDNNISAQGGIDTYTLTAGTIGGNVNSGSGDDIVTIDGTTIAGNLTTQNGNDTISIASGGVAGPISAGDDDDSFTWSGGTIGSFTGGNGSDSALVTAITYDGSQSLNGGDDLSTTDGFIDTLTIKGITATVNAGNMINWENIIIDGGAFNFAAGNLSVGGDAGVGLTLQNGAILNTAGGFALTGNLNNDTGIISSQNGLAGDVTSISGNYSSNNGQLHLDTELGNDASATDIFTVGGNTSGNTTVTVTNAGGTGSQTVSGIEIIQVGGVSAGDFLLNGDFVTDAGDQAIVGGAFGYTLTQQADGDWALISDLIATPPVIINNGPLLFSPATPIYEAITQNMLTLTELQTLQQRAGNRSWSASEAANVDHDGGWLRIIAGNRALDSKKSTTHLNSSTQHQKILFGLDLPLRITDNDQFIVGINGSYAHAKTNVNSFFGDGNIDSDSYSMGVTATSYASNGLYLDGQLKYSVIDAELHSKTLGSLGELDGKGLNASLEIGKRILINPEKSLSITPQAQLSYSKIDFDRFTGTHGEEVSLEDDSRLTARIGITLNQQLKAENADSDDSRRHLYGIANILHEFDQATSVIVTGTELKNKTDKTFLELGLGASYNWDNDHYSVFGEITAETSLDHFRKSNSFSGTLGIRMKF